MAIPAIIASIQRRFPVHRTGALAGAGGVVFPAVDDGVGGAVGCSRLSPYAHYVRLDPRKHADIVT
jgi:hypothetical protein